VKFVCVGNEDIPIPDTDTGSTEQPEQREQLAINTHWNKTE
jgi:hypothetical protein